MRLDVALVARGFAETRSKARDLIERGAVSIDGTVKRKAGAVIADDASLQILGSDPNYVSRGALKLVTALSDAKYAPDGRTVIDVGASTGGFTDVLLRSGAAHVYAVDVGHGQLHPRLQSDDRVTSMERTDARVLTRAMIPAPVTAIVSDVSFISLTQALPAAMALAAPEAWMLALIKPQFELDASEIGKGGIVKSDVAREKAVRRVREWLDTMSGWKFEDLLESPITGRGGNVEYLIGARFDG